MPGLKLRPISEAGFSAALEGSLLLRKANTDSGGQKSNFLSAWQHLRLNLQEEPVGLLRVDSDLGRIACIHPDEVQEILDCVDFLYGFVLSVGAEKQDFWQVRSTHSYHLGGKGVQEFSALNINSLRRFVA